MKTIVSNIVYLIIENENENELILGGQHFNSIALLSALYIRVSLK
jgi:hypothetical protein